MPPRPRSDATLSIRLLWPFARLINKDPRGLELLASAGIELADLGNPEARIPFTTVVRALEETVAAFGDLVARVREEAATELRTVPASIKKTARRLGLGVATLRRKLEGEGTTFSEIVDDLRRELAEQHLSAGELTISEVAFLLGFSDVRAFARAFRRWTGASPSEYRAKVRGAEP